jgi:hypothetical protein
MDGTNALIDAEQWAAGTLHRSEYTHS